MTTTCLISNYCLLCIHYFYILTQKLKKDGLNHPFISTMQMRYGFAFNVKVTPDVVLKPLKSIYQTPALGAEKLHDF